MKNLVAVHRVTFTVVVLPERELLGESALFSASPDAAWSEVLAKGFRVAQALAWAVAKDRASRPGPVDKGHVAIASFAVDRGEERDLSRAMDKTVCLRA